jgi:hypothetical protein
MDMLMRPGITDITEPDIVLRFLTGCLIRFISITAGHLGSIGTGTHITIGTPFMVTGLIPIMRIRPTDTVPGDTDTGVPIRVLAGLYTTIIEIQTEMRITDGEQVV